MCAQPVQHATLITTPDAASPKAEPLKFDIAPEAENEAGAIEQVLDAAFGIDRRVKTSYRLREGVEPLHRLSLTGHHQGRLMATIRFWPIRIGDILGEVGGGDGQGKAHAALFLGPLAVHPDFKGRGAGLAMMRFGLDQAKALGHALVLLVGDQPYYARAGFARVPDGRLLMPGPVDPDRLLYLELEPGAFAGVSGLMGKARPD